MTVFHEPFNLFMVNIKFETNKLSQYSFFARNKITNFLYIEYKISIGEIPQHTKNASFFFNVSTFMAHWKSMYAKYMTRNMWGNKSQFLYLFSRWPHLCQRDYIEIIYSEIGTSIACK